MTVFWLTVLGSRLTFRRTSHCTSQISSTARQVKNLTNDPSASPPMRHVIDLTTCRAVSPPVQSQYCLRTWLRITRRCCGMVWIFTMFGLCSRQLLELHVAENFMNIEKQRTETKPWFGNHRASGFYDTFASGYTLAFDGEPKLIRAFTRGKELAGRDSQIRSRSCGS